MEAKTPEEIVNEALASLSAPLEPELTQKYEIKIPEEDQKVTKKKFKKNHIEENDSNEKALEKVNKLLEELSKAYEAIGKQIFKTKQVRSKVELSEGEKQKANKQKLMFENLFNNFKKKYDQEIKNAEKVQKEEQQKRKEVIQELQERIKTIQAKYEEAGKYKIEKLKENETLKHQLSKYEPHLLASESLADAQLKKKSIEIEIQMTTLKQKIQMMNSFKTMREQTEEKLKKAKELDEKLSGKLDKLGVKEDEHKMSLAKAHLIFEDYKKAFNVLKVILPQKEKEAFSAKEKVKKGLTGLDDLKKKNDGLDKDYQTHADQLQVLKKLEQQLQKQIDQ